jgi:hypothetical protein
MALRPFGTNRSSSYDASMASRKQLVLVLERREWRSPGPARTHCPISVNYGTNLKSTSLSYIGHLYYFLMVRSMKRNCSILRKSISRQVLTIICVGNAGLRVASLHAEENSYLYERVNTSVRG